MLNIFMRVKMASKKNQILITIILIVVLIIIITIYYYYYLVKLEILAISTRKKFVAVEKDKITSSV